MTVRLSTGVRNAIAQGIGFASLFNRGVIQIYSGSQPNTADSAIAGTLLGTVTIGSGAYTPETRATGTVTITGVSGSTTAVTVGTLDIIPDSDVPFNTSAAQTAADLADAINRNGIYTATASAAVVTLVPRAGTGAAHNGYVVSSTGALTATYANISGGVNPVNGLFLSAPVNGTVSKPSTSVWSFNGIAAGTAGWFRFIGSATDAGANIVSAPFLPRLDGSIATSGGDMNLSSVNITFGGPNTIDSLTLTLPAQ